MSVVVTEPVPSGAVILKTTLGDISIELWAREAPKAVRNFVQLCMEGYYDGSPFHRVVPNFIAQTGDPTGTGQGGESIYDDGEFEDEFNQRLKFNRRGLVAMANQGKRHTNLSQFFITLDRTDELQNRNTIFGRVIGDTLFNVLKLNEIELEPGTEKPVYPPSIKSVEVLDNPFEDIVPRITAKERKEQDKAKREMKLERAKQKELGKRKGTKNVGLLSFGDEPGQEGDGEVKKTKFLSSHDALDDPRLSKEVKDDRGTSVNLPPGMMEMGPPNKKVEEKRAPAQSTSKAQVELVREKKKAESTSQSSKVQAEIAKVQADLKRMTRDSDSDSDDSNSANNKKAKKPKRVGPSLLQLEREKYTKARSSLDKSAKGKEKGKRVRREDPDLMDALGEFTEKLLEAKANPVEEEVKESVAFDEEEDDEDINGSGWLAHKLVFRKDATLDRHSIDEYAVVDPLNKSSLTLDEINFKSTSARKYPGERGEREGGGGGSNQRGGGGGGDRRGGGGRGGGGYRDDRGGSGGGYRDDRRGRRSDDRGGGGSSSRGDRPEVQGSSWKNSRVSRDELA